MSAPDFFSTLSTKQLHAALREAETRPLEELLNTGEVRIDFDRRRIHRDSFWKGSFAKDTPLGLPGSLLSAGSPGAPFAGGSFWKRFDRIEDGAARGQVVNYELHSLPGDPEVREVRYPDAKRAYFNKSDRILLLTYRNQPYRIVYDAMKIVSGESALGVMHLGSFPNGIEFSAFSMERHNYPFEKISLADYELLQGHPRAVKPKRGDLAGAWTGNLITLADPNQVLLAVANPYGIRLSFETAGRALKASFKLGLRTESAEVRETQTEGEPAAFTPALGDLRLLDRDTLIGRLFSNDWALLLMPGLSPFAEPAGTRFGLYFVASRSR